MTGPSSGLLGGLLANLAAGARLVLFLPLRGADFRADPGPFALLCAFNIVLWIGAGAVRTGLDREFNPAALAVHLATLPLLLLTAFFVSLVYERYGGATARSAPQPDTGPDLPPDSAPQAKAAGAVPVLLVALGFIAGDWLFELASVVLFRLPLPPSAAGPLTLAFLFWVFLAGIRAVRVCAGTSAPAFWRGAAIVVASYAIVLHGLPREDPWIEPAANAVPPAISEEKAFHRQGELIESELANLARGVAGVPEVYFVGFAPDGSQDVFVKEMRYVRDLFLARYGATGRAVVLANGEGTLQEFPVATATNLRRVLERVAESMNDAEDVLFLFISAHGDRDHRLSAWQPGIELEPVNPVSLARMLRDSGIRSKVIVVSACYSGGFIEPLRDAESLVLTAAASDRTSFGCEHGNDFTYFGRAFFREALARTPSFVEAFAIARRLVTAQETAEGLAASMPQMSQGAGIAERLAPLERAASRSGGAAARAVDSRK